MGIYSETAPDDWDSSGVGLLEGFNVGLKLGEEDGLAVLEVCEGALDGFEVGLIVDGFEVGFIVDGFGVGLSVGAGFENGLPSYQH